jgi:hypothetical protein
MKKLILTTIVALSTIFGLTAQTQTDLHVTLVNPKSMSTIYNQTSFNIDVNVHNMGSYNITPNDTMYFFLFVDSTWITSGGLYYMKMVTGKTIPSGGNLTFTAISNFSLTLTGISGLHEFGTYLYSDRDTSTATGKNNFSSNSVYFSEWGLSNKQVVKSESNVYPNPASDQLNISTLLEGDKTVTIYDITGREVYSIGFSGSDKTLETVSLLNGIYTIVIRNNKNESETRKIQITK